jgi:RNA 3'-terminal phosphate cyclase-like protein
MKPLVFQGHRFLRQRLLLSLLSGCPIKIEKIRSDQSEPGLRGSPIPVFEYANLSFVDYEVSLLRLLEAITNGTVIEISYTGTTIAFKPGFIAGSPSAIVESHKHDCPLSKPIGYYLEPLLLLAAFGKSPTSVVLSGITAGGDVDPSVDLLRVGLLPVLKRFGIEDYEVRVEVLPNLVNSLDSETWIVTSWWRSGPFRFTKETPASSFADIAFYNTSTYNKHSRYCNFH